MRKKKSAKYIRVGTFPIMDVLSNISFNQDNTKKEVKKFGKYEVKMNSDRYLTFKVKGVNCDSCGLEGRYFALEKDIHQDTDKYHFNLYGILNGEEVMLTKDHVIPKSKGGKSNISNYKTLCIKCNGRKANKI